MRPHVLLLLSLTLAACATVPPPRHPVHAEVGVAFDRNGDIANFADGIADPQTRRRITVDDPVRVASVSKMVTAIGQAKAAMFPASLNAVSGRIYLGFNRRKIVDGHAAMWWRNHTPTKIRAWPL